MRKVAEATVEVAPIDIIEGSYATGDHICFKLKKPPKGLADYAYDDRMFLLNGKRQGGYGLYNFEVYVRFEDDVFYDLEGGCEGLRFVAEPTKPQANGEAYLVTAWK